MLASVPIAAEYLGWMLLVLANMREGRQQPVHGVLSVGAK
jgi:hypothetical protein